SAPSYSVTGTSTSSSSSSSSSSSLASSSVTSASPKVTTACFELELLFFRMPANSSASCSAAFRRLSFLASRFSKNSAAPSPTTSTSSPTLEVRRQPLQPVVPNLKGLEVGQVVELQWKHLEVVAFHPQAAQTLQVEASEVSELADGGGNVLHLVEVEGKDPQTLQLGDAVGQRSPLSNNSSTPIGRSCSTSNSSSFFFSVISASSPPFAPSSSSSSSPFLEELPMLWPAAPGVKVYIELLPPSLYPEQGAFTSHGGPRPETAVRMGGGGQLTEPGEPISGRAAGVYTWEEVQSHCNRNDQWLVIDRKVYNITQWTKRHPGGI
ncbi:hypothetical protein FQN60_014029, partial [Etheostoma spectabile]